MRAVRGVVEIAVAVHEEQEHVSVSQVGAGRYLLGAELAVLVSERQVPGRGLGHEVEHPAGELVVVDTCITRRRDRVHGPWCGVRDEQLMLCAVDPRESEVDRAGRDRRRKRPKVVWRRAGDGRELAETPVRQSSGAARRFAEGEIVVHRLGPECAGLDGAFFELLASCASGLVERVDAGVSLVGWARGPFAVSGVRGDSGHTSAGHMVLLSNWPWGRVVGTAPTPGGEEGWPGRPQRRYFEVR